MPKPLALFCLLHPASVEKREQVLSLLAAAEPYYRSPEAKCTTWTYFTPSQDFKRFGIPANIAPRAERDTIIAGMELYTDKSALSDQLESAMFKNFEAEVEKEQLYSKKEEMIAWYPVGGFISREDTAEPFGGGVKVLMGWHVCKPGQRDRLVKILSEYADWVKENEPGFLTYSIMTRPKAVDEVLVFERCNGVKAFQEHVSSPQMAQAMDAAKPCFKIGRGQEWSELDNAFVGNVVGGRKNAAQSKL